MSMRVFDLSPLWQTPKTIVKNLPRPRTCTLIISGSKGNRETLIVANLTCQHRAKYFNSLLLDGARITCGFEMNAETASQVYIDRDFTSSDLLAPFVCLPGKDSSLEGN